MRNGELVSTGPANYVPVSTCALWLGVTRQRVHALVKSGQLVSVKMGSTRLVSMRSVQGLVELRNRSKGVRHAGR
jgi:hypothetical protein